VHIVDSGTACNIVADFFFDALFLSKDILFLLVVISAFLLELCSSILAGTVSVSSNGVRSEAWKGVEACNSRRC
jgi:hypothetical protein